MRIRFEPAEHVSVRRSRSHNETEAPERPRSAGRGRATFASPEPPLKLDRAYEIGVTGPAEAQLSVSQNAGRADQNDVPPTAG